VLYRLEDLQHDGFQVSHGNHGDDEGAVHYSRVPYRTDLLLPVRLRNNRDKAALHLLPTMQSSCSCPSCIVYLLKLVPTSARAWDESETNCISIGQRVSAALQSWPPFCLLHAATLTTVCLVSYALFTAYI